MAGKDHTGDLVVTRWVKLLSSLRRSYEKKICEQPSSLPEMFCKKCVLGIFGKFTGKCLWQRLSFNKVTGLRSATLLKKGLWHRCFRRSPFFTEHLRWLLNEKLCFDSGWKISLTSSVENCYAVSRSYIYSTKMLT